jgi:SAM-dependent methyltransferase
VKDGKNKNSKNNNDPLGQALWDYHFKKTPAIVNVLTNIAEDETISAEYFFRDFEKMPELEQKALDECFGKVLDIGAGAGSHALYLQSKNIKVTAIDISKKSVEVMKSRGLKDARYEDIYNLKNEKFDTIFLIMNGIGVAGKKDNLGNLFKHLKSLLNDGGQIILDSSDLIYLFEQEDGSVLIDLNAGYYGEMEYTLKYKNINGETFDWLFVDFFSLKEIAEKSGFICTKLFEDEHYNYLVKLINN